VSINLDIALCRDPEDDYLLALAHDSNADFLITGDKDLLVLKKINNADIINYSDFEKIFFNFKKQRV
jgi:predicted nucleic acid-binding protein